MSQRIRTLPPEVTMKIAAGEIIERPASIVKELLENALDAQATAVKIELKGGGKDEITVTDNGLGIPAQDISLAFLRYATSKINSFEDLSTLTSFGFRGEALPSIASMARVEMTSRPSYELTGMRIVVEEGKTLEKSELGCPSGTMVKVTKLFQHVPARRKFLKSASTEQAYCLEVITRILLGTEQVRAEVISDGRQTLLLPASIRPEERIAILLGREAASHLSCIRTATDGNYRVSGYISHPGSSRTNSKGIYCYVNRRPVRDVIINHALLAAYKNVLPPGRYPLAIIYLELPPGEVDVNVHPTKMEVRFENPQKIYGLVIESIIHSLSKFSPEEPKISEIHSRVEEAIERYYVEAKRPLRELTLPPIVRTTEDYSYLGQLFGCYLLFQTSQGLVVLDQHAAHERILFERLNKKEAAGTHFSQILLVPVIISFAPHEFPYFESLLPELTDLGFQIEPFGPFTAAIKAVPDIISIDDGVSFIRELVSETAIKIPNLAERRNKIITTLACKGAITAQTPITPERACQIFRELKETQSPATCPHGRPTYIRYTLEDLERMFKRR